MKTSFRKSSLIILLAVAVALVPAQLLAQKTNKATATTKATADKKDSSTKKTSGRPFHGKLASVDKVAKTITLGKSTYQITSETKIKKADKPATLEDGVVGEEVSGYAKPNQDGKLVATMVTFGPKPDAATDKKKSTETTK